MKELPFFTVFLGLSIWTISLFGLAYFLWQVHYVTALVILFIGISGGLIGSIWILNSSLGLPGINE